MVAIICGDEGDPPNCTALLVVAAPNGSINARRGGGEDWEK